MHKKIDQHIDASEVIMTLYAKDLHRLKEAVVTLESFPIYEIEK